MTGQQNATKKGEDGMTVHDKPKSPAMCDEIEAVRGGEDRDGHLIGCDVGVLRLDIQGHKSGNEASR